MISRFSLRNLFSFTTVFAIAIPIALARANGLEDYSLGLLTGVVIVGLVQQIFVFEDSPERTKVQRGLRRFVLLSLLICLLLAMFPALSAYRTNDGNSSRGFLRFSLRENAAENVWLFALMLASLTAPWMSFSAKRSTTWPNRISSSAILVLVAIFVGSYSIYILTDVGSIVGLVDMAINGVQVGMSQPAAAQTPEYVEWFGRSPAEFRVFLDRQYHTWPPLLLSTVLLVFVCQRKQNRITTLLIAIATACCAIPVLLNLRWLANGAAAKLFPLMYNHSWDGNGDNLSLISIEIVLLTLYLGSRRTVSTQAIASVTDTPKIASDSVIVGILMVLFGACGIVNAFYFNLGKITGINVESFSELITELAVSPYRFQIAMTVFTEIITQPHHSCQVLMLLFGANWLWRRRKYPADKTSQRWPQLDFYQLLLSPLLCGSLALLVVASLPFVIALMHAAL